jgi:hypothetical protein
MFIKKMLFWFAMEWKDWIGKRVFVKLISGAVYSGYILDTTTQEDNIFFVIMDKFNEKIAFPVAQIEKIKEEKER